MNELSEILRPSWGSEKWIHEGWSHINNEEKSLIKQRMQELFKDGLPFELKYNKALYLYTFSLLAQLEVLAIQVPLKFEAKLSTPEFRARMHAQLLDEIFHGMVFTKIVYLLSAPYALPPEYNDNIEILCNFIRNEDCPKMGIMLLNLIGEGWIEEIFKNLQKYDIAPAVFKTIIDDEHRHVCEADLYRDIGMPDINLVQEKLEFLEEHLLTNIFLQYKYISSISGLMGIEGIIDFMQNLHVKHTQQLKKINLLPSKKWRFIMEMLQGIFPQLHQFSQANYEVAMSPLRQVFMTQWNNPSDPTMVGQFNINVSCLDIFNKKYPPETLTTLMLQTISLGLSENDSFRSFFSYKKLYQSKQAYVSIVVKLPDCGDHLGTIIFENCHTISVSALAEKIRSVLQMMVFCYKKREELENIHPHLKSINEDLLYGFANDVYGYPIPGNAVVSLSNIGYAGYSQSMSPLRSNEAMKFTIMEVERKQVWNKATHAFEVQDILPVSISADHRIFDGNLPIPKLTIQTFNRVYETMLQNKQTAAKNVAPKKSSDLMMMLDQLAQYNIETAYKTLTVLQTAWPEFLALEDLFKTNMAQRFSSRFAT